MSTLLVRWWRPFAGVAVLLLIVAGLDPAAIADRLAGSDVRFILAGVLGLTAVHAIAAGGWRAILGTMTGLWLPWRAALALFYAAQALGGITPANIGGDIHRAAALRGAGHGWSVTVAPLIVQRATSYLALGALALVALVVLAARAEVAGAIVAAGAAFAAAVAATAWLLLVPSRRLVGWHRLLTRLVGGAAEPEPGRPRRLAAATAIGLGQGLAFHVGGIGFTWLLVLAVDSNVPAAPVLAALAVARLALAVPFSPSGLGVQEGLLAVLFSAQGLAPPVALAAMLLARLSLLLTTMIGVALLQRSPLTLPPAPMGVSLPRAAVSGHGRRR